MDPKTFRAALLKVSSESGKAKAFLTDKRLTQHEKLILSAFLDLRDYQNEVVITVLTKIKCENEFVESQRLYCLGCAHNNHHDLQKAKQYFEEWIKFNKLQEGLNNKVGAMDSLFTVMDNLGDGPGMHKVLDEIKVVAKGYDFLIEMMTFRLTVFDQKYTEALALVNSLEKQISKMGEHQIVGYLYDLLDLQVGLGDLEAVSKVLERFKDFRKFKFGPMIQTARTLLDYLMFDKPLYLYVGTIKDIPQFHKEMQILLKLQERDEVVAHQLWDELHASVPNHYFKTFGVVRKPSLFSMSLKKLSEKKVVRIEIKDNGPADKLVQLLIDSNGQLSKEELFEKLWGEPVESKDDLNRLAKVVMEARSKYEVEIKSVKSTYVLTIRKSA